MLAKCWPRWMDGRCRWIATIQSHSHPFIAIIMVLSSSSYHCNYHHIVIIIIITIIISTIIILILCTKKDDQGGQIGGRLSSLFEQCPKVNDYFVQTKITICSHFGQEKKDFIKGKRGLQFWDFPPKIQFVKEWLPEQWCRVSLVDSAMAKCIVLCTAYRLPWVTPPNLSLYFKFFKRKIIFFSWFVFGPKTF